MTTNIPEAQAADLDLRESDRPVGANHCYRCGWAPCLDQSYGHDSCSAYAQPEGSDRAARNTVYDVLRDLGLQAPARDWLPGTGTFLRLVATELIEWADTADRARQ